MCGINGIIKKRYSTLSKNKMTEMLHKMNNKIVHRGPDNEGYFVDDVCGLGMRRLSIIDLSGGNQPIWNENHSIMIICNGEIYNHNALRSYLQKKGHIFKTMSDVEVVLHSYEEYGMNFLDEIEGMFALCIYNAMRKEWILARDRFGEKPLYYYIGKDEILFGSELKSICETGMVKPQINQNALSIYLRLTYIPAPWTILDGVCKLEAASMLIVDSDGNAVKHNYWDFRQTLNVIDEVSDYSECKRRLRNALFTSVEQRMISDVPLGAFLSGGFDSSIIVGIMSQLSDRKIDTFTIGFQEKAYDESGIAEIVARKNHTNHHTLILDWNEMYDDLDYILSNMDEPFADSSLLATYSVSKFTKKFVSVALTGDAGDELFAGYNKYLANYYSERYQRLPFLVKCGLSRVPNMLSSEAVFRRKLQKVIDIGNLDEIERIIFLMSNGFKEDEAKKLMMSYNSDCLKFIEEIANNVSFLDAQSRNQFVDLKTVLEGDMLVKVDRASMLASLETRVPMLDRKVVELAYSIPTKYKIDKTKRKIILKDTFSDLIPDELFSLPKRGFEVPISKWLKNDFAAEFREFSSIDYLTEQNIFDSQYINTIINEHMKGQRNRAPELWLFFIFQHWYKRMME